MTFALHGIAVSRGIAIGEAHILHRELPEVGYYPISLNNVEKEVQRYQDSLAKASHQLREIRDRIPGDTPTDIAEFIDTHLLMLQDSTLSERPIEIIRVEGCNAEWALKLQCDALCRVFDEMDDPYLRTRRDDVAHVVNRIQINLSEQKPLPHETAHDQLHGRIVIADDLSPADVVMLDQRGIAGFITEYGGPLSHSAILARNLSIPAIVGAHNARLLLDEGENLILDGHRGVLIADTDNRIQDQYLVRADKDQRQLIELDKLRGREAVTQDGEIIELLVNIEFDEDLETLQQVGRHAVGLYRTEFLYMNRNANPTEEEHYQAYTTMIRALEGQTLTLRTMDLGADKPMAPGSGLDHGLASNPALGLRAIRLCLKEPGLFMPQLRGILRASAHGPVQIMLPMISNIAELRQARRMIDTAKNGLDRQGIDYDPEIPVGAMIEVPSAALCADAFAKELDFLSIGTNDLIQYTLAIDRVDDEVNYLYDPTHPAVLKLILQVIEAGKAAGIPVSMCGEMAGDTRYTTLLLGMGLRAFSMHPQALLPVKKSIIGTNLDGLRESIPQTVRQGDSQALQNLLQTTH